MDEAPVSAMPDVLDQRRRRLRNLRSHFAATLFFVVGSSVG
jgi:hypothetical protein